MNYRLTKYPDVVVREPDEIYIPRDHRLWVEYEAWLAEGNTPTPLPLPTFEEVLAAVTPGVQAWMDGVVQQKGYDSVVSCATYATSGVAGFKADADAVVAWRDAVWTAAYAWRDGLGGQLPQELPSIEDVIAQLPQPEAFGWNPQPYDQPPE